jgi:hypothetical protein
VLLSAVDRAVTNPEDRICYLARAASQPRSMFSLLWAPEHPRERSRYCDSDRDPAAVTDRSDSDAAGALPLDKSAWTRLKLYVELASAATSRTAAASRLGGTPNIRRYSRLNCEGLS